MMHPTLVPSECKIMYGPYEYSTIGGNTPVACLFTTRHDTTRQASFGRRSLSGRVAWTRDEWHPQLVIHSHTKPCHSHCKTKMNMDGDQTLVQCLACAASGES
jgi:hypothetical protein